FQLSLDAIDALLRSLRIAPDLQVVRNTASLLFRVMIDSSGVSAELKKIVPILKDPAILNGIIADLVDLPSSYRGEMVALYETAITNSPGSWLKDDPNIYEEYARNLLMVYGEGELTKVLEIAKSELFAWSYMKSQNVVPDGVLKVLRSFKEDLKSEWVEALYGEVASWCKERVASLKVELESLDISDAEKEKLNNFLKRADDFIKLYEYFLDE
ncbi:MAG TPA: O-antigen ligase family protein, partial [Mesotoga infera]|nr:O-antigen ligase family protein [Mesotoga infera]